LEVELEPLGLDLLADPIDGSPVDRGIAGKRLLETGPDRPATLSSDRRRAGEDTTDGRPVPRIDERGYWNRTGEGEQEVEIVPDESGHRVRTDRLRRKLYLVGHSRSDA
jgi:hypothetical protein